MALTKVTYAMIEGAQVNVQDFGAVNDGATDNTSAIQAAINSLTDGGVVYFPEGTYKITGTLTISVSGVSLIGSGRNGSILKFANGSSDCIVVTGSATGWPTNQLLGFQLSNFTINHTGKTGGRSVYIAYAAYCSVSNIVFNNVYAGIQVYVTNTVNVENVIIQGVTGAGSYGLYFSAPGDGTFNSTALTLFNVTVNALYSGADGMVWDGYATTLNADQLTFLECRYGLHIKNTAASNAYYPQFAAIHNFNTDGIQNIGLYIEAGQQLLFTDSYIGNTSGASGQGGTDTNALKILPDSSAGYTRDLKFTNCRIGLSKESAVSLNTRDTTFVNCSFETGSTTPNNTYPAIDILTGAEGIQVVGCTSNVYGNLNNWSYGARVRTGTVRIQLIGNNFALSQTNNVLWENTDSASVCNSNLSTNSYTYDPAPFVVPSAVTSATGINLTAAEILGGIVVRTGTSAPFTDTLPTAASMVAGFASPAYSKGVPIMFINATGSAQTLTGNTGLTLAGNTSGGNFIIGASSTRTLIARLINTASGTEAVTFYG